MERVWSEFLAHNLQDAKYFISVICCRGYILFCFPMFAFLSNNYLLFTTFPQRMKTGLPCTTSFLLLPRYYTTESRLSWLQTVADLWPDIRWSTLGGWRGQVGWLFSLHVAAEVRSFTLPLPLSPSLFSIRCAFVALKWHNKMYNFDIKNQIPREIPGFWHPAHTHSPLWLPTTREAYQLDVWVNS